MCGSSLAGGRAQAARRRTLARIHDWRVSFPTDTAPRIPSRPNRMDPEGARLLEAHLPDIERIVAQVSRRQGLKGDDADDFRSWTIARLADSDGAILRKFRGDSTVTTFLVVVINNLFRDYRIHLWGKWRPSAAARQLGTVAVALEALLSRDGRAFPEAVEELRSRGMHGHSERQLAEIAALLPLRTPTRPVEPPPAGVANVPSGDAPDRVLERGEAESRRDRAVAALGEALDSLPTEDAILVRLRFLEGFTLAAAARTLGLAQKPLYRRIERILRSLRGELERREVTASEVEAILSDLPPLEPDASLSRGGGFRSAASVQSEGA